MHNTNHVSDLVDRFRFSYWLTLFMLHARGKTPITHRSSAILHVSLTVHFTCLSTKRDVVFTNTPYLRFSAKSIADAASGAKSGVGTLGLELTTSLPAVSPTANYRTHPSFITYTPLINLTIIPYHNSFS